MRKRDAQTREQQLRLDGGIQLTEEKKGLFRVVDGDGIFRGHVVEGDPRRSYSWMVILAGVKVPAHARDFEHAREVAAEMIEKQNSVQQ